MRLINAKARISICGQISQYNLEQAELGPRWFGQLLVKRARHRASWFPTIPSASPRDSKEWGNG